MAEGEEKSEVIRIMEQFEPLSNAELITKIGNIGEILECDVAALVLRNRAARGNVGIEVFEPFKKLVFNKNAFFRARCYAIQGLANLARTNPEIRPEVRRISISVINSRAFPEPLRKAAMDYGHRSADMDREFINTVRNIATAGSIKKWFKGISIKTQNYARGIAGIKIKRR